MLNSIYLEVERPSIRHMWPSGRERVSEKKYLCEFFDGLLLLVKFKNHHKNYNKYAIFYLKGEPNRIRCKLFLVLRSDRQANRDPTSFI